MQALGLLALAAVPSALALAAVPSATPRGPIAQLARAVTSGGIVPLSPLSLASLAVGATLKAQRTEGHAFSITRLSRRPHVFCLRGLLSEGEVEHILKRGRETGLQPAVTFGDAHEKKAALREAFDEFDSAGGTIDEDGLGAILGVLGIQFGDDELQPLYEQMAAASSVDGVDFEAFAGTMVEEEVRRKCDIAFLESDGDAVLAALNRDIKAALLSPEVSAHPVAFEDLHVLEYAAGRRSPH